MDPSNIDLHYRNKTTQITFKSNLIYLCALDILRDIIIENSGNTITISSKRIAILDKMERKEINNTFLENIQKSIIRQISLLNDHNYSIDFIHPSYVLNINNIYFIMINSNRLFKLENNNIIINSPFKCNKLMSPDQLISKQLPCKLNKNIIIYSLGVLLAYLHLNDIITVNDYREKCKNIYYTPIYFTIERCITKRVNLLI